MKSANDSKTTSDNFAHLNQPPQVTLLVDDDEITLDTLYDHMQGIGSRQIHRASSAREALRILGGLAQPPDLIVCDLFMPDMDGIEFLQCLVKQKFAGDVIVISGGDSQMLSLSELIGRTQGLRVLASLNKPVTQRKLEEVIQASRAKAE